MEDYASDHFRPESCESDRSDWSHGSWGLCSCAVRLAPIAAALCLLLGFGSLPASADAVDTAVAAARQAANLTVSHASIGHLTSVCSRAAEIVGSGPSIDLVFAGFRGSPTHWSVLSDPGWTSMGTASAQGADGKLYVAVVFCEGAGGSSAPPPPQTPPPAPASPPAHTPPADESTPAQPAARSPLAEKTVPDIEVDLVGLLTAILTTSLDSLTAEDDLDDPIASLLERYVQLPVGLKIL